MIGVNHSMFAGVQFGCVKCGSPMRTGCDCWNVELRCPECNTSKMTDRDESWPKAARTVVFPCGKHVQPDSPILFLAEDGREIVDWD